VLLPNYPGGPTMISIAIACALIIYLFGYLDSPNYHGIAWAAKMICHRLTNNQQN
jgi:hypothetical protein